MADFFDLYDCLLDGMQDGETAVSILPGAYWTGVETAGSLGLAMTTSVDTVPRCLPRMDPPMPLKDLAAAVKSWNLLEAGCGMAAVNAYYNTPERLALLDAYEPFERYCTDGIDLHGKRVGVIGHLNMPASVSEQAEQVLILERNPRPGDYPDSACDALLPDCDVVIITASTLVNKTLPHLLDLCRNSTTILAGPTAPMCPALLEFGFDRIAGLVVTDFDGMRSKIQQDLAGPPYPMGKPFVLRRESL